MLNYEYTIKETSAIYRWTFDRMLSALPIPGTDQFSRFCKEFKAHKITPADVSFEAPSQRLSDVALTILLSDQRISLKLMYASVELIVNKLFEDDSPMLLEIGQAVFRVLKLSDNFESSGHATVVIRSHLDIGTNVDSFLSQQLPHDGATNVILDGMLCRISPRDKGIQEIRMLIARSLVYPPYSLFLDATFTYVPEVEIRHLAERVDTDWDDMLSCFGLVPNSQGV